MVWYNPVSWFRKYFENMAERRREKDFYEFLIRRTARFGSRDLEAEDRERELYVDCLLQKFL